MAQAESDDENVGLQMTASRPFCDRDVRDGTVAYSRTRGREAQVNMQNT